jgi:hypothetical protein
VATVIPFFERKILVRFLILDLRLSQQVCIHDHAGLFMIAWLYSFMDDELNGSHLETVAV